MEFLGAGAGQDKEDGSVVVAGERGHDEQKEMKSMKTLAELASCSIPSAYPSR